ncbi:MAG: restriction endonuclease subunit S [Oligoflexia bacterium]|nr:restriction endonuclease subunit S [Oligoflexia bacterium]
MKQKLPQDWTISTLSEIVKEDKPIVYGIVQAGPHDDNGVPYLKSSDVGGEINIATLQKTSKIIHNKFKRAEVNPGDIVFSLRGNIGEKSIVPKELTIANLTQGTARISVKDNLDFKYVYYQLENPYVIENILKVSKGSTFREISLQALRNIQIPIANSYKEQQKIAKILSTWDAAIEKLKQLVVNKKKRKCGLIEKLFFNIRKKFKTVNLDSIGEILPSNVDKKINDVETEVRLCNYVDVYKNNKITNKIEFMVASASEQEIKKFKVLKDDLIITKDSETAKDIAIPAYVSEDIENLVCGYHLTLVRPDSKKLFGHFLYYYFLTERSRYYFFTMANGAIRFGLSVDAFKEASIPLPDLDTQKKIISVLNECEEEIESTLRIINLLKTQKKGLMQQLLTGKKRVIIE